MNSLHLKALKEASRALTELDPMGEHHNAALIDDALQASDLSKHVTFTFPGGQYITVQAGQINSNLKEVGSLPHGSTGHGWNGAIDGVESLLLAMATRGIPLGGNEMREAVATTIESLAEQFPI